MRRVLTTLLTLTILTGAGCKHHARKVACNDCVELGDPFPSGGARIGPTEVPLAPRVIQTPTFAPEQRNYAPIPYRAPSLPPREILLPPVSRPTSPPTAVPARVDSNTVRAAPSPAPAPARDGLPGYVPVAGLTQVASGRKPTPTGFDTLKRSGFRSILYIHAPGTDSSAAAELAQARGLKLTALPVAPETLGDDLSAFSRTITDASNRPLYVVDDSSVRAGSLWYLYFRTREYAGDDAARVRATPLGLPADTTTDDVKIYWIAVQKVLAGG